MGAIARRLEPLALFDSITWGWRYLLDLENGAIVQAKPIGWETWRRLGRIEAKRLIREQSYFHGRPQKKAARSRLSMLLRSIYSDLFFSRHSHGGV